MVDAIFELGDLELELGGTLRAGQVSYRTHGTLAPARDNAILFPNMYSCTPASLDPCIGAGEALDSERWFVVYPGQLGNGICSSPSTTAQPFSDLTIGDDVTAQHRLVTN